ECAHAVLAARQRCHDSDRLDGGRSSFGGDDCWCEHPDGAGLTFCSVSVPGRGWTGVYGLPVGCTASGSWVSRDFPRLLTVDRPTVPLASVSADSSFRSREATEP